MADFKAIEAIPGWYSVAKKAGELYDTLDAYEKVPMLHRAVNLRAEALGTVPYQLERNGVYVDYPFVTPLESLIQQTEKALLLFGRCVLAALDAWPCAVWLSIPAATECAHHV
jgi:hypothetical protein